MSSKRKTVQEVDSEKDDSGEETLLDECYITVKLLEYVEKRTFLWLTSDRRYKDSSLRNNTYLEFDKKFNLKEGTAQSLRRRSIMSYRKFQKRMKENEVSGSGAVLPEDTFPYAEEISFLGKEEELSKGHRSSSATFISSENDDDDDIRVVDDSAKSFILPQTSSAKKRKSSKLSIKREPSDTTKKLLKGGGYSFDGIAVSLTAKPVTKKKKREDPIERLIAEQDATIEEVMDKLNDEDMVGSRKYEDLKSKLVGTLDNIPMEHRSSAQDEIYLFLSSLQRKFSNANPNLIHVPSPYSPPPPSPYQYFPNHPHFPPSHFPPYFQPPPNPFQTSNVAPPPSPSQVSSPIQSPHDFDPFANLYSKS